MWVKTHDQVYTVSKCKEKQPESYKEYFENTEIFSHLASTGIEYQ